MIYIQRRTNHYSLLLFFTLNYFLFPFTSLADSFSIDAPRSIVKCQLGSILAGRVTRFQGEAVLGTFKNGTPNFENFAGSVMLRSFSVEESPPQLQFLLDALLAQIPNEVLHFRSTKIVPLKTVGSFLMYGQSRVRNEIQTIKVPVNLKRTATGYRALVDLSVPLHKQNSNSEFEEVPWNDILGENNDNVVINGTFQLIPSKKRKHYS
jgi:hypothetical protein